jgi:hypothetical protein
MKHPKYNAVQAPLRVNEWNEESNTFRFGLPLGWHHPKDGLTLPHEPGMVLLAGVTNWQEGDPPAGEIPVTARPYLCPGGRQRKNLNRYLRIPTGWQSIGLDA